MEKEQLYYIRLSDIEKGFLNHSKVFNTFILADNRQDRCYYQTKFTLEEIKQLGDKYLPFAIEMEKIDNELI